MEEDVFKPDTKHSPGQDTAPSLPSPEALQLTATPGASHKLPKRHPERSELLSHLQHTTAQPVSQAGQKRPFSCSFGDHDYCQVLRPEAALQRKVLRSWEPIGVHLEDLTQQGATLPMETKAPRKEADQNCDPTPKDSMQLRDHEIRASLTKHFGLLETALEDEDLASCKSPEYDTVFEDSSSSSGESSFLLEEEEEEEGEEEDDEGEDSGVSPPCSDHCPYQSPPSKASRQLCSRSRSSSGSSSCSSWSPATRKNFRYSWWPWGEGYLSTR